MMLTFDGLKFMPSTIMICINEVNSATCKSYPGRDQSEYPR